MINGKRNDFQRVDKREIIRVENKNKARKGENKIYNTNKIRREQGKWSKKEEEYNMGFEKKKYSEKIRTKLKKNNHHSDIHDK